MITPTIAMRLTLSIHFLLAVSASMVSATAAAADVPDAYVQSCDPAAFPQRACIQTPIEKASPLPIGQKTTARVDAQCWWSRTGVLLEPAGVYEVEVTDKIEAWRDAEMKEESDLRTGWRGGIESFVGFFAKLFARDIHSPMYSLVGARGRDPKDFVLIGDRASVTGTHPEPVELLAFANDWSSKYKNNHGCLELTIKRTR